MPIRERDLVTGNETPRMVAHRRIVKASTGKHIVQTINHHKQVNSTEEFRVLYLYRIDGAISVEDISVSLSFVGQGPEHTQKQ
jgi:hypothetical protein